MGMIRFLSAAEGQRPRNYSSFYCCCLWPKAGNYLSYNCCSCWIFRLVYALSTPTTVLPPFIIYLFFITIYHSIYHSAYRSVYCSIYPSVKSLYLSNIVSIYLSIYPSSTVSVYLSLLLSVNLSIITLSPQTQEPVSVLLFLFLLDFSFQKLMQPLSLSVFLLFFQKNYFFFLFIVF